jgi:hypothetical protein
MLVVYFDARNEAIYMVISSFRAATMIPPDDNYATAKQTSSVITTGMISMNASLLPMISP